MIDVHPSHQARLPEKTPEATIAADIRRDFPWQLGRLALAAAVCRCWRHWYGNPLVKVFEYRRIKGRWFWRVRP